ncbi:pyridoxal phosphate-dependent decarboxylase family protein [Shewanella litorisediminis]|uniref:Aspartate aminotransferase family protein n=1 Tax=Shewanella litorisediminis TaxID=1173586 RepID=A0ABX7G7Z5_9GAMM|nr:pyridoxal-dependent decarboxylase [Shewanella litorisediminis]MCL2919342.1 pyridoxal-dependent decarboxylase [Shewanella litorisediminis]QRH03491.1 aspartate aminotransferase family protein [Shewanella litorisediminis]
MEEYNNEKQLLAANIFKLAAHFGEEYISGIAQRAVGPGKSELDALKHFNTELPITGANPFEVVKTLHQFGSPATMATTGGRFFGLVVGGVTPAALGASVLTAAWDQVAIVEATAPSAIYLERLAGNWLLQLFRLPSDCSVGFTTGTTVSNLVCLAAARNELYARLGFDLAEDGLSGVPPLKVLVSEQSHVTVFKALSILGIGNSQIQRLPCDLQGRINPAGFSEVDESTIVCLQAGNVNSGSFDQFDVIVPHIRAKGGWVHVDGAFGLWAAASPDKHHLIKGVELADSWAVDAHKWLNTPYDCGIAICRHAQSVHNVMTTQAPYLTPNVCVPPKDMVPEFSRRARGVEVWAAIQEMGKEGIRDLINRCCDHAKVLSEGLKRIGFEILNDVVLNQVVATIGTDEDIADITRMVLEQGICWFGTTYWQGKTAIRLSVASWMTTSDDIHLTLDAIEMATHAVLAGKQPQ